MLVNFPSAVANMGNRILNHLGSNGELFFFPESLYNGIEFLLLLSGHQVPVHFCVFLFHKIF